MIHEKRAHERVSADCSFAIKVGAVVCRGKTRNISLGGVLARLDQGNIEAYSEQDEGSCRISYNGKGVDLRCRILRIVNLDIAMQFIDIDFEQDLFLRTLIAHYS